MKKEEQHSLLVRQLAKIFPDRYLLVSAESDELATDRLVQFIAMVNTAYHQFDKDRTMLERSLELSSLELMQSNAEQRAILDAFTDVIIIMDPTGQVVDIRSNTPDVLGFERPMLIGRNLFEVSSQNVSEKFKEAIKTAQKKNEIQEIEFSRKEGEQEVYYEVRIVIQYDRKVVIIMRDVTKRKSIEKQLAQAQKLESVGILAAGIAHEINNPMQYIQENIKFIYRQLLGFIEEVKNDSKQLKSLQNNSHLDDILNETPKALCDIREGVQQIIKIISSIREYSHCSKIEPEIVNLQQAFKSAMEISKNAWKNKANIKVDINPNATEIFSYKGDLNQCILNLLVNAVDAIDEKEETEAGEILLKACKQGDFTEIVIADNGIGISDDIKNNVFDLFFTTKEVGKGTGQGLSIVHGLVTESLNGTISFKSESGGGTEFKITIPDLN